MAYKSDTPSPVFGAILANALLGLPLGLMTAATWQHIHPLASPLIVLFYTAMFSCDGRESLRERIKSSLQMEVWLIPGFVVGVLWQAFDSPFNSY